MSVYVYIKIKVEKADDVKARMILEKLDEDELKENAKQEMMAKAEKQESCQKEFNQDLEKVKVCLTLCLHLQVIGKEMVMIYI